MKKKQKRKVVGQQRSFLVSRATGKFNAKVGTKNVETAISSFRIGMKNEIGVQVIEIYRKK